LSKYGDTGPTDNDIAEIETTTRVLDEEGRVTSESTETIRKKEGQEVDYIKEEKTYVYNKDGKRQLETRAVTEKTKDDKPVVTTYDATGKPTGVTVDGIPNEEVLKAKQQNYKYGTALQEIMGALQTPGVGRFVGLFMDDDAFAEWRENVDEFFCKTIIGGGIECWTSKLCQIYSDMEGDGYLSIESPSGLLELAVHVEGERTTMVYANESGRQAEYLYKFSMMVRNPQNSDKDIEFNVYLMGLGSTPLYQSDITLGEGESFQRMGAAIVVQYSGNLYQKICIKFNDPLNIDGGRSVEEVCNKITEYSGGVVPYETIAATPETGGDGTDNGVNQVERDI